MRVTNSIESIDELERTGEFLEAYDVARKATARNPDNAVLAYRAVLALARCGATEAALRLYSSERLAHRASTLDQTTRIDVAALEARLHKDRARLGGRFRLESLRTSFSLYSAIADDHASAYPAINAATLALLLGETASAKRYAREALSALPHEAMIPEYWTHAIRAEAALILDRQKQAAEAILQAAKCPIDLSARATTLRQLAEVAALRKVPLSILDPLRPKSSLHYTGKRFDAEAPFEHDLRARVGAYLEEKNVGSGFGSLASGTDIVVAEELIQRKVALHVFLPFETEEFIDVSVRSSGEAWTGRFRRCLKCATSVRFATNQGFLGDDLLFAYTSRYAMGTAILNANRVFGEVYQLAANDGSEAIAQAGTSVDMAAWASSGHKTELVTLPPIPRAVAPGRRENTPARVLRAMMFGDVHGYSELPDRLLPTFNDVVLGRYAATFKRFGSKVEYTNTWGDGLYAVVTDAQTAAECALALQSDMIGLSRDGFPPDMGLRLAAHFGPVFPVEDPITGRPSFTGNHVSRTARIEPVTPEGAVYVTDPFAAELLLLAPAAYRCEYVGTNPAAKHYGPMRMHALMHAV